MLKAKYTKPLTISLPPELYEKIEEESDRQEISKGKYVRRLLENGMNMENDGERAEKTKRKKSS